LADALRSRPCTSATSASAMEYAGRCASGDVLEADFVARFAGSEWADVLATDRVRRGFAANRDVRSR